VFGGGKMTWACGGGSASDAKAPVAAEWFGVGRISAARFLGSSGSGHAMRKNEFAKVVFGWN